MTKAEVVNALMTKTGISRNQAIDAVEIFLDSIKSSLKDGEKVSLVGFGTFRIKEKNARNGRNPRTGEKLQIQAKRVPIFKPGKSFREAIEKNA